jgi:hypothetical protein
MANILIKEHSHCAQWYLREAHICVVALAHKGTLSTLGAKFFVTSEKRSSRVVLYIKKKS